MSSALALVAPSHSDPQWAALPADQRRHVSTWVAHFRGIDPARPVTAQLKALAARTGVGYSSVRRRWDALRDQGGHWSALVDGRSVRSTTECPTKSRAFRDYWIALCETHHRSTSAAYRALVRAWSARQTIPGYPAHPGWPDLPAGWSERNLRRLLPPAKTLGIIRRGIKASHDILPQTLTTRAHLWPGAIIQCDDVWHDHLVRWGKRVTRVLEFGALDVWSGSRFAWGSKPRMPKEAGGHLTENEFRFFLASVLWRHGISPRGTVLMLEHGTATLRDHVEGLLHDSTGGLLQVRRSGIIGKRQAILGFWEGRGGGNPRAKTHLESLHSLLHGELSALPGQTGRRPDLGPETTHGIERYQLALLRAADQLPAELAAQLRHPLLDYHTQFLPLRDLVYSAIDARTEHRLEGWEAMGRTTIDYRLAPDSPHWLALDSVPDQSRPLLLDLVRRQPAAYSRPRKLSPAECWRHGSRDLQPIGLPVIADLIGLDAGRETTVSGSYIEIQDIDVSSEPLIYEARVTAIDGSVRELPAGEKLACLPNPYAPDTLIILDPRGRCVGHAQRVQRICPLDTDALHASWGHDAERQAERLSDVRQRHAPAAAAAAQMREHNDRLLHHPSPPPAPRDRRIRPAAEDDAETLLRRRAGRDDASITLPEIF